MRDELKTTTELQAELEALRQRVAELELSEADRIQASERVRESEEHYRAAVDNVADAIVINVGTTRVFVNNAFLTLHGLLDMSQASGLALDHFIVPEDRPMVSERTLARERGEPVPGVYEYRIRRTDGDICTVETSAVAITFHGQPATLAVLRDITERKEAEEELVRLASIVESSDDAIIGATLNGVIISWNAGAERIFGYPAADVVGRPISVLVPPDLPDEVPHIVDTIRLGEHVGNFETVMRKNDSTLIDVSLTVSPVKNASDETVGASTIARDITQRKQTGEEEHRRSQEMAILFSVANTLAQPGHFRDKVTNVLEDLVELTQADQVALRVPDDKKQGLEAIAAAGPAVRFGMRDLLPYAQGVSGYAFQHGEPIIVNDYPNHSLASAAGVTRGIKSMASLPVKVAGRIIGVVNILSREANHFSPDRVSLLRTIIGGLGALVENARLYETLEQRADELTRSNAELEQFAYAASHDLQEPLRMVTSYVQILHDDYKGKLSEDADRFIGYAIEGATRMKALIDDLLAFSRVGTETESHTQSDCNQILEQALGDLDAAIVDTGAVITHEHLPTVNGNPTQLAQLFQNLISNGMKFHGENPPRVHVGVKSNTGEWVFSVRDNGIGIPSHQFDRIFLMFQRLHHRSEYPGTGIGLALCQKIVQRHGGRIWVESELDLGSTFYFTIKEI